MWKPEYAQLSKETQDWYSSRQLTEEAQKRFMFKSCCAHSDVVKTKFKVDTNSGEDQWWFVDANGQWQLIPNDIIHEAGQTPTGEPVLFAVGGKPVCFFPSEGGI